MSTYYKRPYYRKRFYRYYGNRRFKQITSKYCYTKVSISYTIKNRDQGQIHRYTLYNSDGQPCTDTQGNQIFPFNVNFTSVLGNAKGWLACASLYGKYKLRGVAVSVIPNITQITSFYGGDTNYVVVPWDGNVCIALTGNTNEDTATWPNVIENNKRLMFDPKTKVRAYWTIDDKSWHYTNQESAGTKSDAGPPWKFVIGTSKNTNTAPPAGMFPDDATVSYVFPEYFIDFTYYIMFYNQLM